MKRAIGLIIIIVAVVMGFLSIRGVMPFMPIFGSSMEPELQSGSLLLIDPIEASEVEVGDIIIYSVPSLIRDYYNYPPLVAHRVIRVNKQLLTFRTAGDNTGEDPFAIRSQDLRGTVGKQIPHLGLPLLFLQSQQGLIFVAVSLALLAFFLYGGELTRSGKWLQRGVFAPVIKESHRTNRVLTQKIESSEQKMDYTQQALEKFAAAIELYAQHLSSHTSAIQGLSEASHELKRGAAEQNRVLTRLMQTMEQPRPVKDRGEELIPQIDKIVIEIDETTPEVEKPSPVLAEKLIEDEKTSPEVDTVQTPPGCAINRKALIKRLHEIS